MPTEAVSTWNYPLIGQNCACGTTFCVCNKCGDSRCLSCDPYDELDDCGSSNGGHA